MKGEKVVKQKQQGGILFSRIANKTGQRDWTNAAPYAPRTPSTQNETTLFLSSLVRAALLYPQDIKYCQGRALASYLACDH